MRTVDIEGVRCLVACDNPARTAKFYSASRWLSRLPPGVRVVTWSSGGHGQAVAAAALRYGLDAGVVVPHDALPSRVAAIEGCGASVLHVEGTVEDCRRIALQAGGIPVPGYDDVGIIVGHRPLFAAATGWTFVPVGGGGLVAGAVLERGGRRVVAVQHEHATSLEASLAADRPTEVDPAGAPGALRVPTLGRVPFEILRSDPPHVVTVTDDDVAKASELLARAGVAHEPAGAVGLAGALGRDATAASWVVSAAGPRWALVSGAG